MSASIAAPAVGFVVRLYDEEGYSYYVREGGWSSFKCEGTVYKTEGEASGVAIEARTIRTRSGQEGRITVVPTMHAPRTSRDVTITVSRQTALVIRTQLEKRFEEADRRADDTSKSQTYRNYWDTRARQAWDAFSVVEDALQADENPRTVESDIAEDR